MREESLPGHSSALPGRRGVALAALAAAGGLLSACTPAAGAARSASASAAATDTGGSVAAGPGNADAGAAAAAGQLAGVVPRAAAAAIAAGTVRLHIYGDSITVGGPGWYQTAAPLATSWVGHLSQASAPVLVKAKGGATTELLAQLTPASVPADVVLFALGTNDLTRGRDVATVVVAVADFLARYPVGSMPPLVAMSAIGPRTAHATAAQLDAWNGSLQLAAEQRGWLFIDPWTALRGETSGQWADPALTRDGLHPTLIGSMVLGQGYDRALAWALSSKALERQ